MKSVSTVALLALALPAFAAPSPQSDTFEVALDLQNRCTIAIDDLNFGTQNTLASDIDATTEMRIRCTGISSQLRVDVDGGNSGNINARQLRDANGNAINYQVYAYQAYAPMSPAHIWIGFGQNLTWTLHGRVFGGQNPKPAGSYADTLTATVTF